ncbi:MAG TPA: CDP-diacylglycerol--serine O-phosphatidyltransferase [Vicinamibacteria bacterium]|nr:CDP-diacylglycerol--serine O-phosphatidyltransferase [Vicinamibacteria bacterium]
MPTPADPSAPDGTRRRPVRFRRGVAILPSLFTTGNLFLGFWAVIKTLHGRYEEAAPLIGWAIVLDLLDGYIARLTGTTSEFGGELDSLADVISFGVAPAVLAYAWAFGSIERVGWLAAFLFVVCGALRLARFNVQRHVVDSRFFVGLPIPAAAAQVAAWVLFMPEPITSRAEAAVAVALMTVWSFLMVSTFRYRSFKKLDLRSRRSYITVLGIALLFLLVALEPRVVLLALATAYWLSAPVLDVVNLGRRRREPAAVPADAQETSFTA